MPSNRFGIFRPRLCQAVWHNKAYIKPYKYHRSTNTYIVSSCFGSLARQRLTIVSKCNSYFRSEFEEKIFYFYGKCENMYVSSFICYPNIIMRQRFLHTSVCVSQLNKASSKVEETVRRLKDRQVEKLKETEVAEMKDLTKTETKSAPPGVITVEKQTKSLKQRFIDECKHYYSGFRLLFLDVKLSSKILWKLTKGNALTRRENRQLVRTVSDLFRLVPFSVFILVPFMEFMLPIALKLFPGLLPSTFTTSSDREKKLRLQLNAKLAYAKFLQKTLDEMPPKGKGRSSQSARDFVDFYARIKTSGERVENKDILKYSKLFEDEITLDNMTHSQLRALCRLLELTPFGTNNFLRFQLEMKLRQLKADDRIIQKEGISSLSVVELQNACKERGMRALGLSQEALAFQLEQWLDLSLSMEVPPSLLLLSRTLYLPEDLDPGAQIAATISALPESAAVQTRANIGELEGKIHNVTRLELIMEEQRKIDEESKMDEKIKLESELKEKALAAAKATTAVEDVIVAAATALKPEQSVESSSSDLSVLKTAIETLSEKNQDFEKELKVVGGLKRELADYEEDIEDLKFARTDAERNDLKESVAAKLLFSRVNRMLTKVDRLVESLQRKEKEIAQVRDEETRSVTDREKDDLNLVTVHELINAVKLLQDSPNSAKMDQIAQVVSRMDSDSDGVINIDHVMKVIPLLGRDQTHLEAKHINTIIDMLEKEEILEIEDKIDAVLNSDREKSPAPFEIQSDMENNLSSDSRDTFEHISRPEPHKKVMKASDAGGDRMK